MTVLQRTQELIHRHNTDLLGLVSLASKQQEARALRTDLLKETDYLFLSDAPQPTEAQVALRQALRDLTAHAKFNSEPLQALVEIIEAQ